MSEPTSAPTILVVDDDPHILLALRLALQSRGYVVRAVPNGPSALAAAQDARPDAVVVDLAMPRMDGVEVIERLRTWTRIPIIVLSAHTDEANKVRALDAGADDFVDKPFGNEELLARIRSALRREQARPHEAPVLRSDDLEIDLVARRVARAGTAIHLTPREYDLLRELAINPDRVLTHGYLLRTVFGPGYEDAGANLRVLIGQLRRKIERDPAHPELLINEAGVGYRFRLEPNR
jgi:two-component system, OmpR family, KDP operon response regulator KdpE